MRYNTELFQNKSILTRVWNKKIGNNQVKQQDNVNEASFNIMLNELIKDLKQEGQVIEWATDP